jgi:hypothetical protein
MPMRPRVILPVRSCGKQIAHGVDRDREADADVARLTAVRDDRGVDADHLATHIEEWTTGVAGIDRRVGLQDLCRTALRPR